MIKSMKDLILNDILKKYKENSYLREKRRRIYLYLNLDYLLSMLIFTDFFSQEAFKALEYSLYISSLIGKNVLTVDILIFSLLKNTSYINITNKKKYNLIKDKSDVFYNTKFSHEVKDIFKDLIFNSLYKFKTPVITIELIMLTLLERGYLCNIINNKIDKNMLKYTLLKKLHKDENFIKTNIAKNSFYFAYLLKIALPSYMFNKLKDNKINLLSLNIFRNKLLKEIIKKNILVILKKDIYISLKSSKNSYILDKNK